MSTPDDGRTIGGVDNEHIESEDVEVSTLPEEMSIPLEVPEADAIEQALEVEGDEGYPRED
jgi:hypothetical protein